MEEDFLKRIERMLLRVFLILGIIAIAGVIGIIKNGETQTKKKELETKPVQEQENNEYDWEAGLSDATLWLPDNCGLYQQLPNFAVYDTDGKAIYFDEFLGKKWVLVFWASWCGDCKQQMEHMKDYIGIAKAMGDVSFAFIDRTDGVKETKELAIARFEELGLDAQLFFDESEAVYNMLGMHNIPTTLFVDEQGRIQAWSPKQITGNEVFESYMKALLNGNDAVVANFIKNHMMGDNGGIYTVFYEDAGKQAKGDVLSESQGMMLLYAAQVQDKELFDHLLTFCINEMKTDGLTSWKISDGEVSHVNALLDDFRIYKAMVMANQNWGEYEDELNLYREKLKDFGMDRNGKKYIDFYDPDNKQWAERITLCYIDLETMENLAHSDAEFGQAYEQALQVLENGKISEDFPLYYSWYNYKKERYEKDELNTAEAMVTLLHLAQAGRLQEDTLSWLKAQVENGKLCARYDVAGKVVSGYEYESTAVYALVVQIANLLGDESLQNAAFKKMEKCRIRNANYVYDGAFGQEDGTQILSFDQLCALLAYTQTSQSTER